MKALTNGLLRKFLTRFCSGKELEMSLTILWEDDKIGMSWWEKWALLLRVFVIWLTYTSIRNWFNLTYVQKSGFKWCTLKKIIENDVRFIIVSLQVLSISKTLITEPQTDTKTNHSKLFSIFYRQIPSDSHQTPNGHQQIHQ
jgi:hypothetical protein